MVKNRSRVVYPFAYVWIADFIPSVDVIIRHCFQLWNPSLYVNALSIVVCLLGPRVENSKVRLGISAIPYCPLPASWILHGAIVYQSWCEISLALMPIQEEIFSQEGGDNHSAPTMHKPCMVKLSHGSINDRKTCSALFPCLQLILILLPFDMIEFAMKRVLFGDEYSWEIVSDVDIEISPMKFINDVISFP